MLSIELDSALVGVAVRGDGPHDQFVRALEPWRTDRKANHNYSVWFSADRRAFHRLEWGGCTVVRTGDPERFARALALHLGGHGTPADGLLRAEGIAAIHDGCATVLPATVRLSIARFERALRDGGVVLHDSPWVDVDPYTGEVVLEPPRLPPARFGELVKGLPGARRLEPVAEPGRYPVVAWHFPWTVREQQPLSRADAVATVLDRLRWPLTDGNQLAALGTVFEHTPFGRMPLRTARALLNEIRR